MRLKNKSDYYNKIPLIQRHLHKRVKGTIKIATDRLTAWASELNKLEIAIIEKTFIQEMLKYGYVPLKQKLRITKNILLSYKIMKITGRHIIIMLSKRFRLSRF